MNRSIRLPSPLSAAFAVAVVALVTAQGALAQVSTNTDALPPASPAPRQTNAPHVATTKHPTSATAPRPVEHATPAQRVGLPPDVPPKPPAPIVIPPPGVLVPTHPPVPATPIAATANAKGEVTSEDNGLRVTFGPESAEFSPTMLNELKERAVVLAHQPTLRITLLAYAAGKPDDLSTPRRVALARALNVRSVLIDAGVATTRIYPRAIGLPPAQDNGTADRLDLIAQGTVPLPASQAQFSSTSDITKSAGTEPKETVSKRSPDPTPSPKATK